jgi:REP element-mobilizing transposase RayT
VSVGTTATMGTQSAPDSPTFVLAASLVAMLGLLARPAYRSRMYSRYDFATKTIPMRYFYAQCLARGELWESPFVDGNRDGDGIDGSIGVMPGTARVAPGDILYHVLNRSVGRMHMFRKQSDFEAFERVMVEAHQRQPIRILSYCVLSNHWHFVVWPAADGQVTDFFQRLAHTHAVRWRVSHRTVGYGHLYQDRFKSFPVQSDDHLLGVLRRGATKTHRSQSSLLHSQDPLFTAPG